MIGLQDKVIGTIQHPFSTYQDAKNIETRSYYRPGVFIGYPNLLLKVSVSYDKTLTGVLGYVRTAFRTDRVKKGEIWLKGHHYSN